MKLSPGQILRVLIGVSLLILVASVYLPHLFFTYSTNAVVTGRLITLTTPIDGVVTQAPPPIGTELRKNDVIAIIENQTIDRHPLNDLETEQRVYEERIQSLKRERDALLSLYQQLDYNDRLYRSFLKTRIEKDIDKAKYREQELNATNKQSDNQLKRQQSLFSNRYTSKSKLDEAFFGNERSVKAVAQAQEELERILADLNALRSGVYVTPDGRTDVPYQQQRKDEITIRVTTLDSQIQESTARLDSLSARYVSEEERIHQLTKASIVSQKNTVVWRTIATQGNHIDAKTPVVQLVDCSNVYVDMTIHERYFDKIKPGDKASILLTGSTSPIIGTVIAVRGGALRPDAEDDRAGVTPIRRQREIEIMISFDPEDVKSDVKGDFCNVGRTAEVSFKGLGGFFK